MMQQGAGQGTEVRHPSSPRGGSSNGSNGNMPNFSLLGQQLNNFGSAQQQQQHQNNQHNANPAGINFSLGVPTLAQPFPKVQANGNNGGGDGGGVGFPNMQNVNSLVTAGQSFNQNHQFMNQQMLQQQQQQQANGGGVADFMKINQQQHAAQAGLGMPAAASGGLSAESLMNALNTIQQNIVRLQAMVPFMSQNQQLPSLAVQQQAAAAISQIAQVAANMFPPQQPQQQQPQQQQQQPQQPQQQAQQQQQTHQQPQNMGLSQPPISDPQQQQQLSQIFGASVTQPFNFFQQSGSVAGNTNSGGNSGLGNTNFTALQGGGSGVSVDMGTTATSLANQIAAIDGGVSGNNSNGGAGQGLGVPPKSSPPGGAQNFRGAQVGANHGASVATNMNSGMGVRPKQGSPRSNNQIGNGINRGGSVNGMGAADMSHVGNNRSVNSTGMTTSPVDDHDVGGTRDEDDDGDAENLVPGSYDLVEMEAIEILAEHTHFCEICGKGFKRDANLRMHMRGHGDEYKTPAALARPDKASHEMTVVRPRRFSCPYVGCKRNKKHRKFQPLKTMLCVKNHYRRSHCPKILTCNKCKTKKFSVVADLKTHEKHCGCDKWQCSCGTTFSRKDKLFGHIGLFAGHTPAMQFNDGDGAGALDVSEIGGGPGNPSSMSSPGNDTSGYGLSGGGNMNAGNGSGVGLGGGSGMGLGGNGLQGLNSRGGNPGGGGMSISKDGSALTSENSSSSDSFPSTGLISGPAMLQSLFSNKFYQTTSGGNSASEVLH
ncbi:unnamed protein product [Calypogeia fissa]